ncbi:uncharacterized protein [Ptychodera flava]|uniref:uncharacterized protein isoform X1 n=1 Tax=Ptychodera flava TaxID=63121 RepID=UPI00396A6FF4
MANSEIRESNKPRGRGRPPLSEAERKRSRVRKRASNINIFKQIGRWNEIKRAHSLKTNSNTARFLIDWFYANQPRVHPLRPLPVIFTSGNGGVTHVQYAPDVNGIPFTEPKSGETSTGGHSLDSEESSSSSENNDGVKRYQVTGSVITRLDEEEAELGQSGEPVPAEELDGEITDEDDEDIDTPLTVKLEPEDPS